MKLRPFIAIVAGGIVWSVLMVALILFVSLFWPALNAAVQRYREVGGFDMFNTSMLVLFQFLWPITNAVAGAVTVLISRRQLEVWIIAGLLFAYFAINHWWVYWFDFPIWYNVLVVILVPPAVLLGGGLPQFIGLKPHRTGASQGA